MCIVAALLSTQSGRRLVVVVVFTLLEQWRVAALLLGKVSSLGGEQFRSEIVRAGIFVVGVAALARLAVLKVGVRGEKALVVRRAAEGLLASCLRAEAVRI